MKTIYLYLCLCLISFSFAQEPQTPQESQAPPKWVKKGVVTFLVNQSSFDNWIAGGVSNFSGAIGINYDFNYKKNDWTWENKLLANFGLTKIKNQNTQKSSDLLEWNSVVGKKATEFWYYSAFLNFKTQFADDLNSDTKGPTKFLSPAYIQFGPGMLWKKSGNLKINISPITNRFILVDKNLTKPNKAYFGVEEGKSSRYEIGGSIGANYKFNLMKNITMENILNLYSNYLEDAQNMDLDYTMNMVMTINKFISANLTYQAIYDDNAFRGLQTRQVFGLGVNYIF